MRPRTPRPFLTFILLTQISNAVLVNQTIDDGLGDSLTGSKVQYSPSVGRGCGLVWKSQDTCGDCAITPDRTEARNNTWSSAIALSPDNVTATFPFQGTAIYIYFVIPNIPASTGIRSIVDCDFLVDGRIAGSYTHISDGSFRFQYNTLVYANIGLSDSSHTLMIQAKNNSFMIFDYAQYTFARLPIPSYLPQANVLIQD
ncbi:hypothetical protein BD779DRAFT_1448491 [Infundibulicybe gibba]|nr:hypothetical protein BD779DRAFT_1448491 [Infundibulicybe gibba]